MPFSGYASLVFTVVLLVTTAYFLMGGLPLLVLAHDTPMDERFVRRFFEIYYQTALVAAVGASLSYALWGRAAFALGTGLMAVLAVVLRRRVVPAMENLGGKIRANEPSAIRTFRKVHSAALLANLVQLVGLVWGVIQISI